jgi:hypothetical protein
MCRRFKSIAATQEGSIVCDDGQRSLLRNGLCLEAFRSLLELGIELSPKHWALAHVHSKRDGT